MHEYSCKIIYIINYSYFLFDNFMREENGTVESRKREVFGTRGFILNYQKFELKVGRHKDI